MTLILYRSHPFRQRGFTMIELMVALLIGLFLMGGLIGLLQSNRRAFYSQSALAQLQDSERLATTMMNDVIEQAGYFPDPTTNTALSAFAASTSPPFAQAQTIYGTYLASGSDTISVRYTTTGGDGIINCSGGSNPTGGGLTTYTQTFSVAQNATTGVYQLICTMGGNVYQLVNNVTKLKVIYGVNTSGSGSNVDTYMNASQVNTGSYWNNVVSVYITLTFNIGLSGAGQPTIAGQATTTQISRTISIMSQTG